MSVQGGAISGDKLAWRIGGALLVSAPLLTLVISPSSLGLSWAPPFGDAALAAGLIALAVGGPTSRGVTPGHMLGAACIIALAALSVGAGFVELLLGQNVQTQSAVVPVHVIGLLVRLVLAIVASVEVAHANLRVGGLRWAPLWTVSALVFGYGLTLIPVASLSNPIPALVLAAINQLIVVASPVFLGVIAIVVASATFEPSHAQPEQLVSKTSGFLPN